MVTAATPMEATAGATGAIAESGMLGRAAFPGNATRICFSIPERCNENSPTLQRWVEDLILSKSRRDG